MPSHYSKRKASRKTGKSKRRRTMSRVKGGISTTQAELKYKDTFRYSQPTIGVNYDPTKDCTIATRHGSSVHHIFCLNGLKQGDDNTSREGRQVMMKSVALKYEVFTPQTALVASGDGGFVRMLLVIDSAVNGQQMSLSPMTTAPAAANGIHLNQLFATDIDNTANYGDILASDAFPSLNFANRFTILWDKKVALGPAAADFGIDNTVNAGEYYRRLNFVVQYQGNTTNANPANGAGTPYDLFRTANNTNLDPLEEVNDIQNGALYLVIVGSAATSSPTITDGTHSRQVGGQALMTAQDLACPRVKWSARVRYVDT